MSNSKPVNNNNMDIFVINTFFDVLTVVKVNNNINKSYGRKNEMGYTNDTENPRNLFTSFKMFCDKVGINMRELGKYPEHNIRHKKTGKLSLKKLRALFKTIIRFIVGMYVLRFIFNNTSKERNSIIIECNRDNVGLSIISDYYAYYIFITSERNSEFNYLDYKKFNYSNKFVKYNKRFPIPIKNIYYDLQKYYIPVEITDNKFSNLEFICYQYFYNYNLIDPNFENKYHKDLEKLHKAVEFNINSLIEDTYKSNKTVSYMDKFFSDMIVELYDIFA